MSTAVTGRRVVMAGVAAAVVQQYVNVVLNILGIGVIGRFLVLWAAGWAAWLYIVRRTSDWPGVSS